MIRKGQVKGVHNGDILAQVHCINNLFGFAVLSSALLTPVPATCVI